MSQCKQYAVNLPGIDPDAFVVRGNAYPPSVARYASEGEAGRIAKQCPDSYGATICEYSGDIQARSDRLYRSRAERAAKGR